MVSEALITAGLGRLPSIDFRDGRFPARAALPVISTRTYRYWNAAQWWGDQGMTSQCVAYAWTHWLEDGPVTHNNVAPPMVQPAAVYDAAQLIDEWPGQDYDGTSVRAGAKVLVAQGLIKEYRWCYTLHEMVQWLLENGPLVVGTNWYTGMFNAPGNEGEPLSVTGSVAGGHAYVLNGVNTRTRLIRLKNSWGREWGHDGFAYLRFEDAARLLAEWGECCAAVEVNT